MTPIIDPEEYGKPGMFYCEVRFQYLKLDNLEQGFTIKKKLIGLMYAEIQKDPIGPKATYANVTNKDASEQGFTCLNLDQKREEMRQGSLRCFPPSVSERVAFTENNKCWGVHPHGGSDIRKTLTCDIQMEELQSGEGRCSTILKLSWEDYVNIFEPLGFQTKSKKSANVVVKPYSPIDAMTYYSYDRIKEYNVTHKGNRINTPELFQHKYCCIELRCGLLIEGMFLALRYLPFLDNDNDVSIYDQSGVLEKLDGVGLCMINVILRIWVLMEMERLTFMGLAMPLLNHLL
ncbi:unnamed protein product [Ambrosiozyma monospora]|uniref:Unnamed protein product n=1 Tax=Ambrosiozyma monospora TaxID=43982 RepID=A0ACB5U1Q9_AMBMO|nr:unnamed protein product [Ambrosiozyma monospora]